MKRSCKLVRCGKYGCAQSQKTSATHVSFGRVLTNERTQGRSPIWPGSSGPFSGLELGRSPCTTFPICSPSLASTFHFPCLPSSVYTYCGEPFADNAALGRHYAMSKRLSVSHHMHHSRTRTNGVLQCGWPSGQNRPALTSSTNYLSCVSATLLTVTSGRKFATLTDSQTDSGILREQTSVVQEGGQPTCGTWMNSRRHLRGR